MAVLTFSVEASFAPLFLSRLLYLSVNFKSVSSSQHAAQPFSRASIFLCFLYFSYFFFKCVSCCKVFWESDRLSCPIQAPVASGVRRCVSAQPPFICLQPPPPLCPPPPPAATSSFLSPSVYSVFTHLPESASLLAAIWAAACELLARCTRTTPLLETKKKKGGGRLTQQQGRRARGSCETVTSFSSLPHYLRLTRLFGKYLGRDYSQ